MITKLTRALSIGSLALVFAGANILTPAFAAMTVGATPLRVAIDAQPGETKSFEIKAINRNEEKMKYKIELKDAKASDELGNASFSDVKADDKSAAANWITVKDKEVSVEKNDMTPVKFDITIPKDAAPGGHYAMVLFSPADASAGKGNVGVVGQVGVPVLVKVAGDIKEKASVESFTVGESRNQESDAISFQLKVKNEGNVHVLPAGKIFLKANGKPLTKLAKIKNIDGSEEVVDYLPINAGKGYALPGGSRIYESSWEMNKQYTDVTASYELSFGKEKPQTLTGEQTFSISKNANIESFTYDDAKHEFTAKIKNTGSIQLPLRAQIGIFSDAGGDAKVTISAPKENRNEILKPGESKELKISWDGLKVLAPNKDNKFHAILNYVLDSGEGKTITATVNLPFGEAEQSVLSAFFNADNAIPAVLIIVLLGGIGIFFMRKSTK